MINIPVSSSIPSIAKSIAVRHKMPQAYRYDAYLREYDSQVEILGLVDDPNYDMKDFEGREMLFPKKWVTLGVVDSSYEVRV